MHLFVLPFALSSEVGLRLNSLVRRGTLIGQVGAQDIAKHREPERLKYDFCSSRIENTLCTFLNT